MTFAMERTIAQDRADEVVATPERVCREVGYPHTIRVDQVSHCLKENVTKRGFVASPKMLPENS